jgi:hypothetical protein
MIHEGKTPSGVVGKLGARVRQSVLENPFAWLLLALLLFVEYSNYKKGVIIDRVCELTGPHDAAWSHPKNDREELDNICVSRRLAD